MAILGNFMKWEPMRVVAFGSITNAYTAVGAATTAPINQFVLVNETDKTLYISFDGVNDHLVLLSGTQFVNDVNSNKSTNHLFMGEHENVYVKYVAGAPTSGSLYFSTMFGSIKGSPNP